MELRRVNIMNEKKKPKKEVIIEDIFKGKTEEEVMDNVMNIFIELINS